MYEYQVKKRAPLAFWLLDDTVPFQEYTGRNTSGGKKSGTSDPTTSIPLVAGAAFSSVFKSTSVGQFVQNVFKVGLEDRPFALEAWILPIPKTSTGDQQVLSHGTIFDGLSINGKVIRFGTSYSTTGNAFCDYDLIEYQLAHVVGIHNQDQNQLWVNGVLVASVDITDAQKADVYVSSADGNLYSGYTTSTQELAMNAVAFYPSLSGEQIAQNYAAGFDTIGQARVAPQYGGQQYALAIEDGSVYYSESWVDSDDFSEGLKNNVVYATDQINPLYDTSNLSLSGSWTVGIPLDIQNDTSIYGVMVQWTGNNVTVDTSLDGITWTSATNGNLLSTIASGYNPTGKDLQIRVNFPSGYVRDDVFLESLSVYAFRNSNIASTSARTVTVSGGGVVRGDYEPTLYRDDNGVNLHGGTLTFGADATSDPQVVRTIEAWIKPLSGTVSFNNLGAGQTNYRNGAANPGATLPVGEWSLVHIVAGSDLTSFFTIVGDCIVGQVTTYPTALTASDVTFLFQSYTGSNAIRFVETQNTLTISESAGPVTIYAHDWAIDSAG